ncbi:MAG: hypothetical protein HW421_3610 [Ignavibacteria bacterium]|nr:hypothetical protein [Ignavibacteria bacterium]
MNIVDSSFWIEYFGSGKNADAEILLYIRLKKM